MECHPEISEAVYFEEDARNNFIKYMDEYIRNCDIFLLLCSQNSLKSEYVAMEWHAALNIGKNIIPIYTDKCFIPTLLTTRVGVNFNETDPECSYRQIQDLIIKKIQLDKDERDALSELEELLAIKLDKLRNIRLIYNFAEEIGYKVQGTNIQKLGLYNCKIRDFPKAILKFTKLTELYLGANRLKSIPEEINALQLLQYFNLYRNFLKELPDTLMDLTSLERLQVGLNYLERIPDCIGHLAELKELVLFDNKIRTLPETIGQLNSLQWLELQRNAITSLPETIGNIKSLKELYIYRNKLVELPESIGDLSSLRCLSVGYNKLETLPESILDCRSLNFLSINDDHLDHGGKRVLEELRAKDVDVRILK